MKLKIQACSDRGCKRDHNGDTLSIGGGRVGDGQTEELSVDIPDDGTYHLMVCDGPGSIPSGVVWYFGRILLVNSGDSRAYLFRGGLLTQMTPERLAAEYPDDRKASSVEVEDITAKIIDGDMLVICSDGLTDEVSEDEMEVILSNDYEPAIGLVERAKDNGGSDNVSVAVALVGEGDFAPGSANDEYDDDGRYDAWA